MRSSVRQDRRSESTLPRKPRAFKGYIGIISGVYIGIMENTMKIMLMGYMGLGFYPAPWQRCSTAHTSLLSDCKTSAL